MLAVPPAVATCTVKSRPPPLPQSLKPCQRYKPYYLHCCSTAIYYTPNVMKIYLIHNVYCGRKMACQPKRTDHYITLTKTCIIWANQWSKGSFWQSIIAWGYLKVDKFSWPCMKWWPLSIPRKHIYHITLTEVKGLPSVQCMSQSN